MPPLTRPPSMRHGRPAGRRGRPRAHCLTPPPRDAPRARARRREAVCAIGACAPAAPLPHCPCRPAFCFDGGSSAARVGGLARDALPGSPGKAVDIYSMRAIPEPFPPASWPPALATARPHSRACRARSCHIGPLRQPRLPPLTPLRCAGLRRTPARQTRRDRAALGPRLPCPPRCRTRGSRRRCVRCGPQHWSPLRRCAGPPASVSCCPRARPRPPFPSQAPGGGVGS